MERRRKNNSIEILAPVGGSEQLKAAVYCGADAVYFGMQQFNARRNASNFLDEDLKETIRFCHERDVAVHITLNTLIMDWELPAMREAADLACGSGADAVITQDLAVAEYVRSCWPDVEVHASTQMAVHNSSGARLLAEAGYRRIVLARELTLREIAEITVKTDADCEVFVHGAHCMSVSGNCYMSAMIGGRSGNRGLCAQPCRLDWKKDGREYVLSLKDLSYVKRIRELSEAGVDAIKIEGRMKRAEYVAAAVSACVAARGGGEPDMDALRAVFSRSGFTDGFLTGRRTADMFGIRTKEDVTAAREVLSGLEKLYQKEPQTVSVDADFQAEAGKAPVLTVSDGVHTASAECTVPEPARTQSLTEESAARNLTKTGGTPYRIRIFRSAIAPGISVPPGQLNALRREALSKLTDLRTDLGGREKRPYSPPEHSAYTPPEQPALRLRFERADQIFDAGAGTEAIVPVSVIADHPELIGRFGNRLIAELPALVWEENGKKLMRLLRELNEKGLSHVSACNICAPELIVGTGLILHGGPELNIMNTEALERYAAFGFSDLTLSFELPAAEMRKIGSEVPRGWIGYGFLPLMKFRNCPGRSASGCGNCTGNTTLTDRTGEKYPLLCRGKQFSELFNCVPLYVADRAMPRADFETLYFTIESGDRCRQVLDLYRARRTPEFRRTGGLYFRELL